MRRETIIIDQNISDMLDKKAIGISQELRQFIEALVEEVVLEGKTFEEHKKYLQRFCEAEGIKYKTLEKNLAVFFEISEEWKSIHTKAGASMAKLLGEKCYLSVFFVDQLLACAEGTKPTISPKTLDQQSPDNMDSVYRISHGSLYGTQQIIGRVELPSSVSGQTVVRIGDAAFKRMDFDSVVIPDSVIKIGSYAFEGCQRLKVAIIPNSVTEIGEGAFSGCKHLSRVELSCNLKTIESNLFAECENLTDLDIPSSVTTIKKNAFRSCTFQKITIPNSVSFIDDMAFYYCKSMSSLAMPTQVVKIGDFAFGGCKSLKSIVIPNTVKIIGPHALIGCSELKELTISRNNYEKIKDTISSQVTIHFID